MSVKISMDGIRAQQRIGKVASLARLAGAIERRKTRIATAREQAAAVKKLELAKLAKARKGETKLHEQKIAAAKEIFEWARSFAESEEFGKLLKIYSSRNFGIDTSKTVKVFWWGWGHELLDKNNGQWSHISIRKDGTLLYEFGFKYLGHWTFDIKSYDELVSRMSYDYIKALNRSLHSDGVWRYLSYDLERVEMVENVGFVGRRDKQVP